MIVLAQRDRVRTARKAVPTPRRTDPDTSSAHPRSGHQRAGHSVSAKRQRMRHPRLSSTKAFSRIASAWKGLVRRGWRGHASRLRRRRRQRRDRDRALRSGFAGLNTKTWRRWSRPPRPACRARLTPRQQLKRHSPPSSALCLRKRRAAHCVLVDRGPAAETRVLFRFVELLLRAREPD